MLKFEIKQLIKNIIKRNSNSILTNKINAMERKGRKRINLFINFA